MARTTLTRLPQQKAEPASKAVDAGKLLNDQIEANKAYRSAGVPPDWLTTGLAGAGAGWVFGPVGALISAGVTALVSKKRNEGILASSMADAETGLGLIEGGEASVKRLEANARTDQEKLEAALVRDQFNQAATIARHPDPSVSAEGFKKLLAMPGLVSAEADEIEAANLASEQVEREQQQRDFDNFGKLHDDLQRESARYVASKEAWQSAHAIVDSGVSGTNDISLIYKMANINDPGAIVTEGDTQVIRGSGSVSDSMAAFYNQYLKGDAVMSDGVRADLVATIDTLYKAQRDEQIDRNADYQALGNATELGDDYMRVLRVQVDPREASRLAQTARHRPSSPSSGIARPEPEVDNLKVVEPAMGSGIIADAFEGASNLVDDIGRQARGEQLLEGADGRRFVRDQAGELTEVAAQDLFEEENGRKLRRVDHGDGRFEWIELEPGSSPTAPTQREPGLFQEGGFFDRRKKARETND